VVVGVDGSSCSRDALRWALDESAKRDAVLDVVCAWQYPVAIGYPTTFTPMIPEAEIEHDAAATLARSLEGIVAEHEEVEVRPRVEHGAAALCLIEAAKGAELLVVGSRGRGGFKSLLLGSVSQQAAIHAPCPVVIVHGP
jgi:nucleotide-binding universal stress UspA family protein